MAVSQQLEVGAAAPADLIEGALPRQLVGPPAEERSPVAEAFAAYMIVLDLDHQLGRERLPLRGACGAPAAGASRRPSGESGRPNQLLEPSRQRRPIDIANVGCKSHVV